MCLITFASEVVIWGDGTTQPVTIAGDRLADYAALTEAGRAFNAQKLVPVAQSHEVLSSKIKALQEGGSTGL